MVALWKQRGVVPLKLSDKPSQWEGIVLAGAGIVLAVMGEWMQVQRYLPDRWLGDEGAFPKWVLLQFFAMVLFFGAVVLFLVRRSWVGAVASIAFFVVTLAFSWPGDWQGRWSAERATYLAAVAKGEKYGDQFEQEVDGRRLVLWRWWSGGIDNAEGIIYDPEDRLKVEGDSDFSKFHDQTHGQLLTVERIERGWYHVTFT